IRSSPRYPFSLFCYCSAPRRPLHSFPTRRSSDLAEAAQRERAEAAPEAERDAAFAGDALLIEVARAAAAADLDAVDVRGAARDQDRKSTRLNSSHEWISYAVFCLKKKKEKKKQDI